MSVLTGKTLLIVDDESDLSEILCHELRTHGAHCIVSGNVPEALEKFKTRPFDCIVSDIRMPLKSGVELLKTVRLHVPDLPFLLMTGFADIALPTAHALGAEGLLQKPFELEEICQTVAYYCRPLLERWEVTELPDALPVSDANVIPGRGGFLFTEKSFAFPRPQVGQKLDVQFHSSGQRFRVIVRWTYMKDWGGEIIAWDNATKAAGWSHAHVIPFIPLQVLRSN